MQSIAHKIQEISQNGPNKKWSHLDWAMKISLPTQMTSQEQENEAIVLDVRSHTPSPPPHYLVDYKKKEFLHFFPCSHSLFL